MKKIKIVTLVAVVGALLTTFALTNVTLGKQEKHVFHNFNKSKIQSIKNEYKNELSILKSDKFDKEKRLEAYQKIKDLIRQRGEELANSQPITEQDIAMKKQEEISYKNDISEAGQLADSLNPIDEHTKIKNLLDASKINFEDEISSSSASNDKNSQLAVQVASKQLDELARIIRKFDEGKINTIEELNSEYTALSDIRVKFYKDNNLSTTGVQ